MIVCAEIYSFSWFLHQPTRIPLEQHLKLRSE
jgi:hypothetical protein